MSGTNWPGSSWTEVGLVFDCAGEPLVGVLASPAAGVAASNLGVVVVVGGPQYRAGSHRHFVVLSRALAAAGHAVLRFDVRGMGDSGGAMRTFEALDDDIGAAIGELLAHKPTLGGVVLWGLCDGASAALLYCHRRADPRVQGLCLLNPWVRSPVSLARAHVKHYYWQRLRQPEFWRKLLRGGVWWQAAKDLAANLRLAGNRGGAAAGDPLLFQVRMAAGWHTFAGPILLALSENDYTAREFLEIVAVNEAWRGALARPLASRHDIAGTDHTFSDRAGARMLERKVLDWLANVAAARAPAPQA